MNYENRDQSKFLITTIIAVCLFYFPLVIWNYYYRDDFGRVVTQDPGWAIYGRPFADLFAYLINVDFQRLTDSSPFFLLMALFLVVFSAYKALQIRQIPFNATTAILLVTYIFNPFLLSSFFYRFDCAIMAAGLACSVLSWAYFKKSKIISAVLCFVAMGFYQTYINMFLMLVFMEFLFDVYTGKDLTRVFKFLFSSLVLALSAVIFFYLFAQFFIGEYADAKSTFIFFADKGALHYIIVFIENAFSRFFGFLSPTGKVFYGLAILLAFIEIQLHFYKDTDFSHRIARAAIVSFSFLFMLPLSLGALFGIVGDGGIPPRVMAPSIFFSVAVVFLLLRFLTRLQKPSLIPNLLEFSGTRLTWGIVILLLLCPLVFSYIVNNAIRNQNHRDQYLLQSLATSLERYPINKSGYILGHFGTAPFVKKISDNMRLVALTIPHGSAWVIQDEIKEYGYYNIISLHDASAKNREIVTQICVNHVLPDIKKNYYAIYDLSDFLFIWLGNNDVCTSEFNGVVKQKL